MMYDTLWTRCASFMGAHVPMQREKRLKQIHQILPHLGYGDGVSDHALAIRDHLRGLGYKSDIFVRQLDDRVRREAKAFSPLRIRQGAGLLYHHYSADLKLARFVIRHPGPKCLIYHNITPSAFFEPYEPGTAGDLEKAREELNDMARHFSVSVACSKYSAAELLAAGYESPGVLPHPVAPDRWRLPADAALMERLQDGKVNVLFVGRVAPNKCQVHLVEAFAHYLALDHDARLILVGGAYHEGYYLHVVRTISRLGLTPHVTLAGHVGDTQLRAYYRTAHLFWSMSEHEGFCLPLIEAMWSDVPVLAYNSSAIPETLGGAGMVFESKSDLREIAILANRLVRDEVLRKQVIAAQRRRRADFLPEAVWPSLKTLLHKMEDLE